IVAILTEAPGNGAPIGGVKVVAEHGWFAARPSGPEDIYKLYVESRKGEEHLERILAEAQQVVDAALAAGGRVGWGHETFRSPAHLSGRAHEPRGNRSLHHRAGRRRGQAARAADRRPRQAGRPVRRGLPADRIFALEPGETQIPPH